MRNLICRACKKTVQFQGEKGQPVNVGEVCEETGFTYAFSQEHTLYLCQGCGAKAKHLAVELKSLYGQGDILIDSIIGFSE
mgnify:CR=1 FL=1